jgi:hypothetical protein
MLSVEDPKDPDNDLAKGSFNAPRIRQVGRQLTRDMSAAAAANSAAGALCMAPAAWLALLRLAPASSSSAPLGYHC